MADPVLSVAVEDIVPYLDGAGISYDPAQVDEVLVAEADDQRNRCRFPTMLAEDGTTVVPYYTPAHLEALKRRVAHNLAVRPLPLGLQATVTDAAALATQVGGLDAEVKRFEAPWRKRLIG
jgi:hypothetical protein